MFSADLLASENKLSSFQKNVNKAVVNKYIDNGGYIFSTPDGQLSHNSEKLYTPASILKIATALSAFETLGPEYRFKTSFYLDGKGGFYIKGFGDPFLTSEEISLIWQKLSKHNLKPIKKIYIDTSFFHLDSATADGANGSSNPYDALNFPVSVNFNTLPIQVSKSNISSLEEQTPFIPLMKKYAKDMNEMKEEFLRKNKELEEKIM